MFFDSIYLEDTAKLLSVDRFFPSVMVLSFQIRRILNCLVQYLSKASNRHWSWRRWVLFNHLRPDIVKRKIMTDSSLGTVDSIWVSKEVEETRLQPKWRRRQIWRETWQPIKMLRGTVGKGGGRRELHSTPWDQTPPCLFMSRQATA